MSEVRSKIRVLRIIARMNIGGPAIQVTNLMQSLPESRFEQLLAYGYCDSKEQDYLEVHKIKLNSKKIKSFGRSINPLSDFVALFEIMRLIKAFQPDIVHTHTFKAGLIGRIAVRILPHKVMTVHTFHGHLLRGYFGNFGTRVLIIIERYLAKKTDRLVSVGAKVKAELLACNIGVPEQYEVIGPGFNIVQPPARSRVNYGLNESDFVCGWFGRLTRIKRADRVLEISQIAKVSRQNQVKFILVGDGNERKELQAKAIALNLPVIFLGWQSDTHSLMKMCDLIICTSDNEGTPISLIEAQMLGRPVISTKVGSVEEVLIQGKTGFALDFEAHEFWSKITFLRDNTEVYMDFSSQSHKFAGTQFSLEKFLIKYISLYDDVLSV